MFYSITGYLFNIPYVQRLFHFLNYRTLETIMEDSVPTLRRCIALLGCRHLLLPEEVIGAL